MCGLDGGRDMAPDFTCSICCSLRSSCFGGQLHYSETKLDIARARKPQVKLYYAVDYLTVPKDNPAPHSRLLIILGTKLDVFFLPDSAVVIAKMRNFRAILIISTQ